MYIEDANKSFNFAIEIDGVDQFYFQDVKVPDVEVAEVPHQGSNHTIKTAGAVTTSSAVLQKLIAANGADDWAIDWLYRAQNPIIGGGTVPSAYKLNIVFKRLGPGGNTIERRIWEGAWCSKIEFGNYKRGESGNENVIETVTLSVDKVRKI